MVSFYKATNHLFTCFTFFTRFTYFTRVFLYLVARTSYPLSRASFSYHVQCFLYHVRRLLDHVRRLLDHVRRFSYIVSRISYYLDIGMPKLNTDSEVAVAALSEGFSPLVILTLRLELLPYQRADTRLSRVPKVF